VQLARVSGVGSGRGQSRICAVEGTAREHFIVRNWRLAHEQAAASSLQFLGGCSLIAQERLRGMLGAKQFRPGERRGAGEDRVGRVVLTAVGVCPVVALRRDLQPRVAANAVRGHAVAFHEHEPKDELRALVATIGEHFELLIRRRTGSPLVQKQRIFERLQRASRHRAQEACEGDDQTCAGQPSRAESCSKSCSHVQ